MEDTEDFMMFENIIASRLLVKRIDNISQFSTVLIDIIINNSEHEPALFKLLNRYMETILETHEVYDNLNTNQILDALKELSNYAAIFVNNSLYTNTYNLVVDKIKNLRYKYPVNDIEWTESKKGY